MFINRKIIVLNFLLVYFSLTALFLPFTFASFPYQKSLTHILFDDFITFICNVFSFNIVDREITSDSVKLWLLTFILFTISIIIYLLIHKKLNQKEARIRFIRFSYNFLLIYLALITMKYGLDKLFHTQFYTPEPNILATPLGKLDQDILFWSTMGTSNRYNVFMGIAEIIPSLLILFPPTRKLGLICLIGVYTNIVAINFSFDISVKLLSSHLLVLSLYLFFILRVLNDHTEFQQIQQRVSFFGSVNLASFLILSLLFFEGSTPYFLNTKQMKPLLDPEEFGSFKVTNSFFENRAQDIDRNSVKNIFFHAKNYVIFQSYNDDFMDFKYSVEYKKGDTIILCLSDYDLHKTQLKLIKTNKISFQFIFKSVLYNCRKTNWKMAPALMEKFHWTVDNY